jgi:methylmalonyl-CoA mutase
MLDFADVVAINKFERRGAMDALRDVGRQMVRNREAFGKKPEDMPVFGTSAATFNDDGVTALYQELRDQLTAHGLEVAEGALPAVSVRHSSVLRQVVPPQRVRYLAEIAETVRQFHEDTQRFAEAARRVQRLTEVGAALARAGPTARASMRCSPAPRTTCRCRWRASSRGGARSSRPTRATSRS